MLSSLMHREDYYFFFITSSSSIVVYKVFDLFIFLKLDLLLHITVELSYGIFSKFLSSFVGNSDVYTVIFISSNCTLVSISSFFNPIIILCKASGEFFIFILKWFFIDLARLANFKVDKVSSIEELCVEHVTTNEVL